jgi:hypothetical protein
MSTLIVRIMGEAHAYVDSVARRKGLTEVDVVQRALEAYRVLLDVLEQDGRIVLHRKDGQLERLVRI